MSSIEDYNLFGEHRDLPDVVHCETIETRSRIHNWEFKPHRHYRLHQFMLIVSGGGAMTIEGRNVRLSSRQLVNIPKGAVHGFSFEHETSGYVVTVDTGLLDNSVLDAEGLHRYLQRPAIIEATEEVSNIVRNIFKHFPNKGFARAHILRSLCGVLAGLTARQLAEGDFENRATGHKLQRRFERLVDERYTEHLSASDYAGMLSVTSTHLSRIMRQATGRSASATIEARVIREARRNLAYSNLSISEIGYQLGYSDPAYFSRVFRRATGQSPREFRRKLDAAN